MSRLLCPPLVLLCLSSIGCADVPRYPTLSNGTYECTATILDNTCGPDVAGGTVATELEGATSENISFLAPAGAFYGRADAWGSVQFGYGLDEEPNVYRYDESAPCGTSASYTGTHRAQIEAIGHDSFHVEVLVSYDGLAACRIPGVAGDHCAVHYDVSCAQAAPTD